MSKSIHWVIIGMATLLCSLVLSCSDHSKKTVQISGSTTIEPFMTRVAALFRKDRDVDITIAANGSIRGIDSLLSGSCDIAMSSSELSPSQSALAEQKGITIKTILLGYDIIVPIVNPDNGVATISLDQLKDVYGGRILSWSELGGNNAVIDIVNRNNTSGTYALWKSIAAPGIDIMGTELLSNSSVLAYVAEHETAIGYISNSFVNQEIKPLKVDGVDIRNRENWIQNHPIKRPLFLYADENKLNDTLKTLIIFIILDERVKTVFAESGFFSS